MTERRTPSEFAVSEPEVVRMTKSYVRRIRQSAGITTQENDDFSDIDDNDLFENIRLGISPHITSTELTKIKSELVLGISGIPQDKAAQNLGKYLPQVVDLMDRIIGVTTLLASRQDTY